MFGDLYPDVSVPKNAGRWIASVQHHMAMAGEHRSAAAVDLMTASHRHRARVARLHRPARRVRRPGERGPALRRRRGAPSPAGLDQVHRRRRPAQRTDPAPVRVTGRGRCAQAYSMSDSFEHRRALITPRLRCGIVLRVQEDACQVLAEGQVVSVRYASQFPTPRRERVSPGHLVAVAEVPGGSDAVVWRWYDAVVLGNEAGAVRLWEPAHGEVVAQPRRPRQRHEPGTRAYLSAGLPGAEWWVARQSRAPGRGRRRRAERSRASLHGPRYVGLRLRPVSSRTGPRSLIPDHTSARCHDQEMTRLRAPEPSWPGAKLPWPPIRPVGAGRRRQPGKVLELECEFDR